MDDKLKYTSKFDNILDTMKNNAKTLKDTTSSYKVDSAWHINKDRMPCPTPDTPANAKDITDTVKPIADSVQFLNDNKLTKTARAADSAKLNGKTEAALNVNTAKSATTASKVNLNKRVFDNYTDKYTGETSSETKVATGKAVENLYKEGTVLPEENKFAKRGNNGELRASCFDSSTDEIASGMLHGHQRILKFDKYGLAGMLHVEDKQSKKTYSVAVAGDSTGRNVPATSIPISNGTGEYSHLPAVKITHWFSSYTYGPGDYVQYKGYIWRALKSNTNKIPNGDLFEFWIPDRLSKSYTIKLETNMTANIIQELFNTVPKNLNLQTLTIQLASGVFTNLFNNYLTGFYNGTIIITGNNTTIKPSSTNAQSFLSIVSQTDIVHITGITVDSTNIKHKMLYGCIYCSCETIRVNSCVFNILGIKGVTTNNAGIQAYGGVRFESSKINLTGENAVGIMASTNGVVQLDEKCAFVDKSKDSYMFASIGGGIIASGNKAFDSLPKTTGRGGIYAPYDGISSNVTRNSSYEKRKGAYTTKVGFFLCISDARTDEEQSATICIGNEPIAGGYYKERHQLATSFQWINPNETYTCNAGWNDHLVKWYVSHVTPSTAGKLEKEKEVYSYNQEHKIFFAKEWTTNHYSPAYYSEIKINEEKEGFCQQLQNIGTEDEHWEYRTDPLPNQRHLCDWAEPDANKLIEGGYVINKDRYKAWQRDELCAEYLPKIEELKSAIQEADLDDDKEEKEMLIKAYRKLKLEFNNKLEQIDKEVLEVDLKCNDVLCPRCKKLLRIDIGKKFCIRCGWKEQ